MLPSAMESTSSEPPPAPSAEEAPTVSPTAKPPQPDLRFLSHEPKLGDPCLAWESFAHPKLRRYPKPYSTISLKGRLGKGVDGCVLHGQTDDGKEVAVKIFHYSKRPTLSQFKSKHNHVAYWAFERECRNCATLELISTRLRRAATSGCHVYLKPNPKGHRDAICNLKAFSDDFADEARCHSAFEPFIPDTVNINECYGWLQCPDWEHGDKDTIEWRRHRGGKNFAIVYGFVPEGTLQDDVVLSSYELFHLAGFGTVDWLEANWRGPGILVDYSDLLRPDDSWWRPEFYGRRVKFRNKFCLEQNVARYLRLTAAAEGSG
ncbi:hypothetical protein RB596_000200 [Gaeumannomyces avenae]